MSYPSLPSSPSLYLVSLSTSFLSPLKYPSFSLSAVILAAKSEQLYFCVTEAAILFPLHSSLHLISPLYFSPHFISLSPSFLSPLHPSLHLIPLSTPLFSMVRCRVVGFPVGIGRNAGQRTRAHVDSSQSKTQCCSVFAVISLCYVSLLLSFSSLRALFILSLSSLHYLSTLDYLLIISS